MQIITHLHLLVHCSLEEPVSPEWKWQVLNVSLSPPELWLKAHSVFLRLETCAVSLLR